MAKSRPTLRKFLKILGIGVATLVGVACVLFIGLYYWVSNPKYERLSLPAELISVESPEGKTLLDQSDAKADHEPLIAHFQGQEKQSWCGVASAVTVLNSISTSGTTSQSGFFNACTDQTRTSFRTTFGGIPLDTFATMIRCHDVAPRVIHAEDSTIDEFRRLAVENLRTAGNFVVVNYDRGKVGQSPTGHISPISAYHAESDRFLILDVANYKYPPVWVKASALWAAMNTIDSESKRTRGFVLVAASGAKSP